MTADVIPIARNLYRCTECSAQVRPIVAVDVDGTISEYHEELAGHVSRYFNIPLPAMPWDGLGNFEDYLGITQHQYREAKLAYRQGGFKRWSPVMKDVHILEWHLRTLHGRGLLEVWITTTRPWNRLDSVDPDTRFWLDNNFPVYDYLLYDDHKYPKLAELVEPSRVVGVLDDLPEMIAEATESFAGAVVRMVNRPHNVHAHPSCIRTSIPDFCQELNSQVERWWTYEASNI
jgi:hypothetical protein